MKSTIDGEEEKITADEEVTQEKEEIIDNVIKEMEDF